VAFAGTVPNKIRVKLINQSVKIDSLDELDYFLGEWSAKPMIRPNLIQKITKSPHKLFAAEPFSPLSLIYEIEYKNDANPELISSKLSKLEYFEYVEPIYERTIFGAPNDTLLKDQYYLFRTQAYEAWDILRERGIEDTVTIAIVDTGVDIEHPDLVQNLKTNSGEIGIDENQNDKKTNGIDDDGNGFIDDWFGWDFTAGENGTQEDNKPMPGHSHGTHVAGICAATHNNTIGIAGTAINVKYYPVKIGYDEPTSISIANGYEGILYAASMGCEIINCSWGGSGYSQAEQDIVKQAVALGSTIIASSGNNGKDENLYPAAYEGVINVGASKDDDDIAGFSNYGYSVDVVAPGRQIISTVVGGRYEKWNGTSMASPVASSIAAMIRMNYPNLTGVEVGEMLKASCDDIDTSISSEYKNKIGTGRVNAVKALNVENPKTLIVDNIRVTDNDGDRLFRAGDTVNITFDIEAKLNRIGGLKVLLKDETIFDIDFQFLNNLLTIGDIERDEKIRDIGPISLIIPDNNYRDLKADIAIKFFNTEDFSYTTGTNFTIYPTYLTFDFNDIATTVNSRGNIGFNDFGENEQGVGFLDKYGNAMLYEGSLMMAIDTNRVSDVARENSERTNLDLLTVDIISQEEEPNQLIGYTKFSDVMPLLGKETVNVEVEQTIIQKKSVEKPELNDMIFFQYDYIKRKDSTSSFYAGLYFDWDMGLSSADDRCYYDYKNDCGVCLSTDSLNTIIGVKLLSDRNKNYYALNNDGTTLDDIGVYNGYTDIEKYYTLASGFVHDTTKIGDVSMIIGSGPHKLNANDTIRDTYVIFTAYDEEDLKKKAKFLEKFKHDMDVNGGESANLSGEVYPNPCLYGGTVTVKYNLEKEGDIETGLYDLSGRAIEIKKIDNASKGSHAVYFETEGLSIGAYFITIQTENTKFYKKLIITK
jgi:hypothetical protein